MEKPQYSTRRTSDQMFLLVERYESGDQSKKDFCAQHGLNLGTFHYWMKKYKEQKSIQSTGSFQQIKVLTDKPSHDRGCRHIEIRTPSGVQISIPMD